MPNTLFRFHIIQDYCCDFQLIIVLILLLPIQNVNSQQLIRFGIDIRMVIIECVILFISFGLMLTYHFQNIDNY